MKKLFDHIDILKDRIAKLENDVKELNSVTTDPYQLEEQGLLNEEQDAVEYWIAYYKQLDKHSIVKSGAVRELIIKMVNHYWKYIKQKS